MLRRREAAGVSLTRCLCALEFFLELLLLLVSNRFGFFIRPLKKKGWFDGARGQTPHSTHTYSVWMRTSDLVVSWLGRRGVATAAQGIRIVCTM